MSYEINKNAVRGTDPGAQEVTTQDGVKDEPQNQSDVVYGLLDPE